MNIVADASLPGLREAFPKPFYLTVYTNLQELETLLPKQDMLLCRAHLKVNEALISHTNLSYVATASSGSDNLDKAYLNKRSIQYFDAKGCNAIAVADYMMSCIALLEYQTKLKGKKIGIIGLGHVGSTLFSRLQQAGFELLCYDPPKQRLNPKFTSCTQEELYSCDALCVHAELHEIAPFASYNLVNQRFLKQLQPHCIVINASRGGIVNEEAILELNIPYCTDVYLNEPYIKKEIIQHALICTPHIAGHSLEAKNNAVNFISKKIHNQLGLALPNYLEPPKPLGSVDNSVSGPLGSATCSQDPTILLNTATTRVELDQKEKSSWQELALSLYNPIKETTQLKEANALASSFLHLRQAHKNRHDFYTYFDGLENSLARNSLAPNKNKP